MRRQVAALALLLAAASAPAGASPYEGFLDVETEQDLYDAVAARHLSPETFEVLRALLVRRVSLDAATREQLYLLPNLTYAEVDAILAARARLGSLGSGEALVQLGILSRRELDAIAPFLVESPAAAEQSLGIDGVWAWAQLATRVGAEDRRAPSLSLRLGVARGAKWRVGAAFATTRGRIGAVRYDPNRDALLAEAPRARLHLAKAYLAWQGASGQVIVGTYRAGFGLRSTFGDGALVGQEGISVDDEISVVGGYVRACQEADGEAPAGCEPGSRITPDVSWTEGRWGLAFALRRGEVTFHGWGSLSPRSVGQYEIGSTRECVDLRQDTQAQCAPLPVFRSTPESPLAPAPRLSAARLPAVFVETLGGAQAAFARDRRTRVSALGYVAELTSTVEGASLAPQEWSPLLAGGPFGAVGVAAAFGARSFDAAIEATRSFDHSAGHRDGGMGAVARLSWTALQREVVIDARYYDRRFRNPYARSVAASDEVEGQRARDEVGVRWSYSSMTPRTSLRLGMDVWSAVSTATPAIAARARGQWQPRPRYRFGLSLRYDADLDLGADGSSAPALGETACTRRGGGAADLAWLGERRELSATATWEASRSAAGAAGHAAAAWILFRARQERGVAWRAHARWRGEAGGETRHTLSGAIEVAWPMRQGADALRLRWDAAVAVDRQADLPSSSLWLTYDFTY